MIGGPSTIVNPLRLSSPLNPNGNVQLSGVVHLGPIELDVDQNFTNYSATNFDGPLTGVGMIRLVSPSPSSPPAGWNFNSPGSTSTGGVDLHDGILETTADNALPPHWPIHLNAGTTMQVQATTQRIESLNCEGRVVIELAAGSLEMTGRAQLLGGCQLVPNGPPWPPQAITIIRNLGPFTISGTFENMSEAATLNGRMLTYAGGPSGRDLVLLPLPNVGSIRAISAPGSITVNSAASQPYVVQVLDPSGQAVYGAIVEFSESPAGCAGFSGAQIRFGTDQNGVVKSPTFVAGSHLGVCTVTAKSGSASVDFPTPITAPTVLPSGTDLQDMWWSPSENGWGMSLVQHDDVLFGALYIYDANGNPTWVVIPGGTWDSTHTIFTGSVYEPKGAPFYAYNASTLQVGSSVGSVSISFQEASNAIVDYSVGGVTGRKFVTREIFANGAAVAPVRSDLWWGGSSQNGWGITVLQQASTLFAIWYTYDANGNRTWYVTPGGAWTASDTYEGALYRTTGSPWIGKSYDPTKLQVINAGTYKFQFNGDAAIFTYSADGHSGSVPLSREPF